MHRNRLTNLRVHLSRNQLLCPKVNLLRNRILLKAKRILRQWNLSSDFSEEVNSPIDTVFSLCNRFRIADKYSPVNATLGNYGLPFYQINFFDRITDPDKFLYSTFYPFMFVPDKALFMNTQVPFTELVLDFRRKKGDCRTDLQDKTFAKCEQVFQLRTDL